MKDTVVDSDNKKTSLPKKSVLPSELTELENIAIEEKRLKLALNLRKF
ncbi:MAG: hypothetical protein ACE5R5_02965 [Nitrosarchaeum sp.]